MDRRIAAPERKAESDDGDTPPRRGLDGLVAFYLLFFYAIGESSTKPDVDELRDSLEALSALEPSMERLPEEATVRDGYILVERPAAVIVEKPRRIEESARERTIHEPSLIVVETGSLLALGNPSSVTIEDPESKSGAGPADRSDSPALLEIERDDDQRVYLSPKSIRIRNPDSVASERGSRTPPRFFR